MPNPKWIYERDNEKVYRRKYGQRDRHLVLGESHEDVGIDIWQLLKRVIDDNEEV